MVSCFASAECGGLLACTRSVTSGDHRWAMKEAVRTLLLVHQRLDAHVPAGGGALPHLPEEIWRTALGFLRSADLMPLNLQTARLHTAVRVVYREPCRPRGLFFFPVGVSKTFRIYLGVWTGRVSPPSLLQTSLTFVFE